VRDFHRRWEEPDVVGQFADKSIGQFFRSEIHFLNEIATDIESVLDVGCAAGRFIELLRHYRVTAPFTGIDVSSTSIELARSNYPRARFICGDALECDLTGSYSLVNATGVLQHDPRFESIIGRMLDWSSRYVLFDVKFADIADHITDIALAYCGGIHRAHYILLAPAKFLGWLGKRGGISRISVYGYQTPLNDRTVIPKDAGPVVSAGILLEKGDRRPPELRIELPAFLKT
jgi:SAM-dependent methyltransferase